MIEANSHILAIKAFCDQEKIDLEDDEQYEVYEMVNPKNFTIKINPIITEVNTTGNES